MDHGLAQHAKTAIDGTLGVGGLTSPWWLDLINQGAQSVALVGGAVLVLVRLYLAYLEWRDRPPRQARGGGL